MSEAIVGYVKRVGDLVDHVRGNEQATKQSLIGPLFTILGYDLTDPRECVPEYRADFGPGRSNKPIDWAFFLDGRPCFFVEAKDVGKKLTGYDEQLADYFAKSPDVKLGILTNGVQWRFYTDIVHTNVMDREPFVKWDVLSDDEPPFEFLSLIQKSQLNAELIRTFAGRKHAQNLLVAELNRLLEPSKEFIRLAIGNIETRKLTDSVVEYWKPVLSNALEEWVKQRMLLLALSTPLENDRKPGLETSVAKIVTTKEELEGFEAIKRMLGTDRPIVFEDTASYFKIHLPERRTWVVCRLYFDRKRPAVWIPIPIEEARLLAPTINASMLQAGWTCVNLDSFSELENLGELLRISWDRQRSLHPLDDEKIRTEIEESEPVAAEAPSEATGVF